LNQGQPDKNEGACSSLWLRGRHPGWFKRKPF
jgi:hypothetical protein